MGIRRDARVNALKSLYLIDVCGISIDESVEIVTGDKKLHAETSKFMDALVRGTVEGLGEIDCLINENSRNWTMDRMPTVDRNILRIGTYELISMPETPVNVIINEAIEIAKEFSTEASGKFVNGILDKIKKARKTE